MSTEGEAPSARAERASESPLSRAMPLLLPEQRDRARADEAGAEQRGFLDLLTDELESTGATQDLMTSRLVPRIYENYWRPALSRVVKGATGPGMAEEVRIARLMLALSPGDGVLDVACGPGNFSREFARTVGDSGLVVGIDASRTMLERGAEDLRKSELGNLVLIRGDAVELPFRDDSFDAVCCFAALHLFADPFEALDQMARVLTPGGRIAILTSVRRQVTVRPLKPLVERASGMRVFEHDELVEALQERGFDEIHQRIAGMMQFVGGRLIPST